MTTDSEAGIEAIVSRETAAWDAQDVEALLDLFHPDMVWAWPPTAYDHDPIDWVLEFGRFDRERWRADWQDLFDTHWLVHNDRTIRRIDVSDQGDAGMAVVDIDTLWRDRESGEDFHWHGRTAKLYTLIDEMWKVVGHWGALEFDGAGRPITAPD